MSHMGRGQWPWGGGGGLPEKFFGGGEGAFKKTGFFKKKNKKIGSEGWGPSLGGGGGGGRWGGGGGGGVRRKYFRHGTDCLRKHAYYVKKMINARTLNEIDTYLLLYMYILFTAVGVLRRAQVSHRDVNADEKQAFPGWYCPACTAWRGDRFPQQFCC